MKSNFILGAVRRNSATSDATDLETVTTGYNTLRTKMADETREEDFDNHQTRDRKFESSWSELSNRQKWEILTEWQVIF